MKNPIYFASIIIEPNRWRPENPPKILLTEWLPKVSEAGFEGIELWQRHYTDAPSQEKARLNSLPTPPKIFSSYVTFDATEKSKANRIEIARAIAETGAKAVKFNLGTDISRRDEYIEQFREWSKCFTPEIQFLYECHPGDVGDKPDSAQAILEKINHPNIKIMVHPFGITPENLNAWFDRFSDSICHAHVHQRDEFNSFRLLESSPEQNKAQCEILKQRGFKGSLTVEFTKGTALEVEYPDEIFKNACKDLHFLRQHLER